LRYQPTEPNHPGLPHPLIPRLKIPSDSRRRLVARWIGAGKHTGVTFDDPVVGKLEHPHTGKELYNSGTTIFKDGLFADENETGEEQALTALQPRLQAIDYI
jgi:hypothetical protein